MKSELKIASSLSSSYTPISLNNFKKFLDPVKTASTRPNITPIVIIILFPYR